ncbi:MAG: hypothetical protein GC150_00220 [Rhizobiales bacterium]|nr:hypothetical protein [Hyphomicrobiales bacterium]
MIEACGAACISSGRRNFPHALTIQRAKHGAKRLAHVRKPLVHRVVRIPHGKPMPHRAKKHHPVASFGHHRTAVAHGGLIRHAGGGYFGKVTHGGGLRHAGHGAFAGSHVFGGGKFHMRRGKPGH